MRPWGPSFLEGAMEDDMEMPGWEPDPAWAALAVVCGRCGAPRGTLCVDVTVYADDTGTYPTSAPRRHPHGERIAEWEARIRAYERRMGWRR